MAITAAEFIRGLVLHLDPDVLEAGGGAFTCGRPYRVTGSHFFVCLEVGDTGAKWLPTYTENGVGRVEIPASARAGHPKWALGTCYYHPAQVWSAPHAAAVSAATAGHDQSLPGQRNTVDSSAIP